MVKNDPPEAHRRRTAVAMAPERHGGSETTRRALVKYEAPSMTSDLLAGRKAEENQWVKNTQKPGFRRQPPNRGFWPSRQRQVRAVLRCNRRELQIADFEFDKSIASPRR